MYIKTLNTGKETNELNAFPYFISYLYDYDILEKFHVLLFLTPHFEETKFMIIRL